MTSLRAAATIALLAAATGSALAQSAAPAAGSSETIPEKTAPGTPSATSLETKKGVVVPTGDVDPGMQVPAPQTGTTPVIKPDATGGGTAE